MTCPRPDDAACTDQTPCVDCTAQWRGRCLLGLAVLNHRQTPDGLTPADVQQLQAVLLGQWEGLGV